MYSTSASSWRSRRISSRYWPRSFFQSSSLGGSFFLEHHHERQATLQGMSRSETWPGFSKAKAAAAGFSLPSASGNGSSVIANE
jgi:hypothetical protein